MKLDRLIGILAILLQRERVTAPALAEKFEVSRRTINRDIETLCMAGIPVATAQGANGGIYIADTYKIDKTLLTQSELADILIGINGLGSIADTKNYEVLKSKLNIGGGANDGNCVDIDLASSWYRPTLAPKIEMLRQAIKARKTVKFDYYAQSGETAREVEPYSLIYQWASWYVWGRCLIRDDWRLFKLNRMQNLETTETIFTRREVKPPSLDSASVYPEKISAVIKVDKSCKWRIIEEYGMDSFTVSDDGSLIMRIGFNDKKYLLGWLMGFCGDACLVEPAELRAEIVAAAKKVIDIHN